MRVSRPLREAHPPEIQRFRITQRKLHRDCIKSNAKTKARSQTSVVHNTVFSYPRFCFLYNETNNQCAVTFYNHVCLIITRRNALKYRCLTFTTRMYYTLIINARRNSPLSLFLFCESKFRICDSKDNLYHLLVLVDSYMINKRKSNKKK